MVIPPSYGDLGKNGRDLFNKGYNYGFYKAEVKTKASNGMEFTVNGSSNSDSGKIGGNLETKYKWKDYGLTFTEKWNTENNLGTEVTIEDQIVKGLKLSFDTQFAPHTGRKSGKIKTAYKMDYLNLACDVDFDFQGPTIHGAAVLGYNGWLAGYQMSFDTSKSKLAKNNFAVGYTGGDFTLHTSVNDTSEFTGSIHQKINKDLETAVNLSWTAGTNTTRFGIGSKYCLDKDSSIRAKVNNSGQIGLGYAQNINDGIQLTLSAMLDAKNINSGGHKVGLGIEFDAK